MTVLDIDLRKTWIVLFWVGTILLTYQRIALPHECKFPFPSTTRDQLFLPKDADGVKQVFQVQFCVCVHVLINGTWNYSVVCD